MGKWKNFSGLKADTLSDAIASVMKEYGDIIFKAADDGVDEAAKALAQAERLATPRDTGNMAKGWKVEAKKYKMVRFVGNNTTVTSKAHEDISLANIIEYSTTRGKPFIKRTYESNVDRIARIIMGRIQKDA